MDILTKDDILSSCESYGSAGKLNVEIRVRLSKREINDNDKDLAREMVEKLHGALIKETLRLDPARIKMREEWITECRALFDKAGLGTFFMEEVPNDYSPGDENEPWFMVTSRIGHIKIGWRKRVMNIDWSRSLCQESGEFLFPNEDVTKGMERDSREARRYIHAWSYEKAVEYLKVITADVDKPRCQGSYKTGVKGSTKFEGHDPFIQCSECGLHVPAIMWGHPYPAKSHDPRTNA